MINMKKKEILFYREENNKLNEKVKKLEKHKTELEKIVYENTEIIPSYIGCA